MSLLHVKIQSNNSVITGCGCLIVLGIYAIIGLIDGLCWQYTVNTWLHFLGKDASLLLWQGVILGIIPGLGQVSLIGAAATFVAMLFLA